MSQIRPAKRYCDALRGRADGPPPPVFHTLPSDDERPTLSSRPKPLPLSCGWPETQVDQGDDPIDHRVAGPFCLAISCTSLSARSILGAPFCKRARGRGRACETLRRGSVLFERHQIARRSAKLHAEIEDEIVDRARLLEIGMHGFLRRAHAVFGDATIVTRQQHRPFGKRHKMIVGTRNFTGSSILPSGASKRTASMSFSSCRRMPVCMSLSNLATLKLVGNVTCSTLTFSSGGRIACGSGLHKVSNPGSKLSHTVGSVYAGLSAS